jgi:predicted nucleic acid-binding Zn ribbon protein
MSFCRFCGANIKDGIKYCGTCGKYLGKNTQVIFEFSFWKMHPLTIIFVILWIILSLIGAVISPSVNSIIYLGGIGWGYLWGYHIAKEYAPKINGSQSWAFIIGFMFGLIGLVCYVIHYKHILKHSTYHN